MRRALFFLCAVLALACAGCGGSFARDWHAAAAARGDAATTRWAGRWESGRHVSAKGKPMGGALRCVLRREDARHWRAHFEAKWLVFTSSYVAPLEGTEQAGELRLRGAHQLGGFGGGLYRYDARVRPGSFEARYDSRYDSGTFSMRPAP